MKTKTRQAVENICEACLDWQRAFIGGRDGESKFCLVCTRVWIWRDKDARWTRERPVVLKTLHDSLVENEAEIRANLDAMSKTRFVSTSALDFVIVALRRMMGRTDMLPESLLKTTTDVVHYGHNTGQDPACGSDRRDGLTTLPHGELPSGYRIAAGAKWCPGCQSVCGLPSLPPIPKGTW